MPGHCRVGLKVCTQCVPVRFYIDVRLRLQCRESVHIIVSAQERGSSVGLRPALSMTLSGLQGGWCDAYRCVYLAHVLLSTACSIFIVT